MATTVDFIEYVCDQIRYMDNVRYRKMFGEYMIYLNDKPILLVCDNTVYVKIIDSVKDIMKNASTGIPYSGAKPYYILDIDNREFSEKVVEILEKNTPFPKPKVKKIKGRVY